MKDEIKKYNWNISTDIDEKYGIIHNEWKDFTGNVYKTIINTQDEHIKEALIKLGWTPPHKEK